MANYNAKVTLEISASKLPQLYPNVQAVTCVKVLIRQNPDRPLDMVGSTEVVVDSNNPVYKRKIEVDFMHRRHQHLTFDVWDVIDKDGDLKGAVKLGSADVQLVRLVRLRGQAMTVLLRDDGNSGKQDPNGRIGAGGAASSKGSFIIVRACRIRREKQFKKGKEEAKEMTTLVWRRVREWRFNKEDGIFEWVNIPRDEQTENTKRKGTISVCFAEDRVSAVMEKVFKEAEYEHKKEVKDGDDPDALEDEDEDAAIRRKRKEEEMTPKELKLRTIKDPDVLTAFLTVTRNNTTRQIRVVNTHETDIDPLLSYLHDTFMFGAGDSFRCFTSFSSHGFVVYPAVSETDLNVNKNFYLDLQEHAKVEAKKLQAAELDAENYWKKLSATCKHCQGKIKVDMFL